MDEYVFLSLSLVLCKLRERLTDGKYWVTSKDLKLLYQYDFCLLVWNKIWKKINKNSFSLDSIRDEN